MGRVGRRRRERKLERGAMLEWGVGGWLCLKVLMSSFAKAQILKSTLYNDFHIVDRLGH
jgi:hypothetical protein